MTTLTARGQFVEDNRTAIDRAAKVVDEELYNRGLYVPQSVSRIVAIKACLAFANVTETPPNIALANIESAAALALEQQWQPIETAPPDEDVWLYCPGRGIANPERVEYGCAHSTRAGSYHPWATHWAKPLIPHIQHRRINDDGV